MKKSRALDEETGNHWTKNLEPLDEKLVLGA